MYLLLFLNHLTNRWRKSIGLLQGFLRVLPAVLDGRQRLYVRCPVSVLEE